MQRDILRVIARAMQFLNAQADKEIKFRTTCRKEYIIAILKVKSFLKYNFGLTNLYLRVLIDL